MLRPLIFVCVKKGNVFIDAFAFIPFLPVALLKDVCVSLYASPERSGSVHPHIAAIVLAMDTLSMVPT